MCQHMEMMIEEATQAERRIAALRHLMESGVIPSGRD